MRTHTVDVTVSVDVAADVATTWAAALDWERKGEWIPLTRVRVTRGRGDAVGDRLLARTAVGPVGFDDPMQIAALEAPHRCEVLHLGHVVRGSGEFSVMATYDGRSRFTWVERLDLPFGALGHAAFVAVRPLVRVGLRIALRRFARFAATG